MTTIRARSAVIARRVSALLSLGLIASCSQAAVLRGQLHGLEDTVNTAEKNGARRCAPRELAIARSHLEFARVDLEQGEPSNAAANLEIAAPNANAALKMSPRETCAVRQAAEEGPGDKDGDGIKDSIDKCPDKPETYNGFQDEDGCPDDPDTDNDGIPDSLDHCPLDPEDKDGYLDDDGCPDLDNDGDGIPDALDKCPNAAEDFDGFQDEDGCPDPDNDGDNVPDIDDFCPNTPGYNGGDKPGCPRKNATVIVTAHEIRITQQIQFEFNRAIIRPVSYKVLDEVRDVLRDNPKISLEIQGHTDNVGQAAYNKRLSEQRADAVRAYLVEHGIDVLRLTATGYGQMQPLVPNNSDANRALNRRVQFIRTEAVSN